MKRASISTPRRWPKATSICEGKDYSNNDYYTTIVIAAQPMIPAYSHLVFDSV
jgi:hypothetical protein